MSDLASDGNQIDVAQGTERPLSDYERAVIQRLLSDPFVFPIQFKTWLISFLESGDIMLPKSSVEGLTSALGTGGGAGILGVLPAGLIFPYGAAVAPTGALLCNGAQYSTVGYKRLHDVIGYTYGGSGSLFAVPDLRRRLPFGQGAGQGIGVSDGRAEASRSISHHHAAGSMAAVGVGNHSHNVSGTAQAGGDHNHPWPDASNYAKASGATASLGSGGTNRFLVTDVESVPSPSNTHTHSVSGGTDAQGGHGHSLSGDTSGGFDQDRPAFLTVGFIINF